MKKFIKTSAILAVLLFTVTSCQSDKNVYSTGAEGPGGFKGEQTHPLSHENTTPLIHRDELPPEDFNKRLDADIGVLVPAEKHGFAPVYFAYNSAAIGTAEEPKLKALANYLQDNPTYFLILGGHCDERGSEEYNRALSERRALAVKDFVVSSNANLADRINTVGYGEDQLVDLGKTAEAHAINRRSEIEIRDKK